MELSFVEREPEEAVQMLRAAELEIAIVFEYDRLNPPEFERFYEGIELHHLIDDPMYLALPRDHPLGAQGRVRLQDVADETWIQESGTHSWCGQLPRGGVRRGRLQPEGGLPVGRLQRRAGPDRGRGRHIAPPRARPHERARGHRGPLARRQGADAADRRRPRSPAATARPATDAMLEILAEAAARFELPSGAAIAA